MPTLNMCTLYTVYSVLYTVQQKYANFGQISRNVQTEVINDHLCTLSSLMEGS